MSRRSKFVICCFTYVWYLFIWFRLEELYVGCSYFSITSIRQKEFSLCYFRWTWRSLSSNLCLKTFHQRIRVEWQLQKSKLLKSFEINIFKNGWPTQRLKRKKIDKGYSKIDEIDRQWTKLLIVIARWMYSKRMADHSWIHLRCECWWFKRSSLYKR